MHVSIYTGVSVLEFVAPIVYVYVMSYEFHRNVMAESTSS